MKPTLSRVILYVQNVEKLRAFYADAFELDVIEEIEGEWAVFQIGACQLALHRVGVAHRTQGTVRSRESTNSKLVLTVGNDLERARERLISLGVSMGEIKSYPGFTGRLCDGTDPEGNVFQLSET